MHTLRVGSLAFLDSFAGLVPVKVLALKSSGAGTRATVRVISPRGPYNRNEQFETFARRVIPRESVDTAGTRIRPYTIEL